MTQQARSGPTSNLRAQAFFLTQHVNHFSKYHGQLSNLHVPHLLLCLLMLVSPADSGVRLPDVALYTSVRRTAATLLFTSCLLLCPTEGLPRMSMEAWPIIGRPREPREAAEATLATLDALDCRLLPAPEELLGRSERTMPAATVPGCC
jgi:hypothetical protein